MTAPSPEVVRTFVLEYASAGLAARGIAPVNVPDTFDLLAEEVVDSFGLLELIGAVERRFDVSLNFDSVDANELTMLGAFSRFVAESASGSSRPEPISNGPAPLTDLAPVRPSVSDASSARPSFARRLLGTAALSAHRNGVRLRDKVFSATIAGGFRRFGSHSVLQMPIRLVAPERISLGSGAFIGLGSWLQAIGPSDDEAIVIGDGASFAGFTVISAVQSVRIGRNVSLARNVYIADHAHAYDEAGVAVLDQGLTDVGPIEIGDGAWLGENVVVLPNVRIGEGAVIGANSVVTGDIAPFSLAVGSPARVIRRFGST